MIRQQRRRIERQWSKIEVGETCTNFIERNNLFSFPHVIAFQAVKVSEELVSVYNVGLFERNKFGGHCEFVTTGMFLYGVFRSLGSMQIAYIADDTFWIEEEIDV